MHVENTLPSVDAVGLGSGDQEHRYYIIVAINKLKREK